MFDENKIDYFIKCYISNEKKDMAAADLVKIINDTYTNGRKDGYNEGYEDGYEDGINFDNPWN